MSHIAIMLILTLSKCVNVVGSLLYVGFII